MRDTRFDLSNRHALAYQEARRGEARRWIDAEVRDGDRRTIQAESGQWLASDTPAEALGAAFAGLTGGAGGVSDRENAGASSVLLEGCAALLGGNAGEHPVQLAASMVLGTALGTETTSISAGAPRIFERAVDLLEQIYDWEAANAFRAAFLETCRCDSTLSAHWARVLSSLLTGTEILTPRDVLAAYGEREHALATEAGDLTGPTLIWKTHGPEFPLSLRANLALSILLQLDLSEWIGTVDSVASVAARNAIFYNLGIREDRELILEGLKRSPAVFADDVFSGSSVALLFLDAALDQVSELESSLTRVLRCSTTQDGEDEAALNRYRDEEAPAWLRTVASTLLQRQDGLWLAIEFAVHVVDREHRRWNRAEWSLNLPALEATTAALKSAGATGDTIHQHWGDLQGDGARAASGTPSPSKRAAIDPLPYLIVAGAVEAVPWQAAVKPTDGPPISGWTWYTEVLAKGGEDVKSQINPHSSAPDWFYRALAVLAARQPGSMASWREAWDALADQRQRYRFHKDAGGGYAPSAHLLRTCRQLLHLLVQRGEDSVARQLWSDLLRFTFDLAYGGRPDKLEFSEYEVAMLFAYAPKVFGPDWEMAVMEGGAILASNARLALVAALNLAKNAIDPDAVRSAFERAGCDLAEALADVQVWHGHNAFTAGDLALQFLDEIKKIFNLPYEKMP